MYLKEYIENCVASMKGQVTWAEFEVVVDEYIRVDKLGGNRIHFRVDLTETKK